VELILQLLAGAKCLTNIQLRVFITSRPERYFDENFDITLKSLSQRLTLHSIDESTVKHDIFVFISHELKKLKRNKRSLPPDWPGEETIKLLTQRAGRLFIYAATVCRYICKSRYPENRLSETLRVGSAGHSSMKELDAMYMLILKYSITEGCDEDNEDMARLFKPIVGSIIILFIHFLLPP
jgi:hypothetical protein